MIALLNLPKPSDDLLTTIIQHIDTLQINNDAKKYYDHTQNGNINCSEGQIFLLPKSIYISVLKEFYPTPASENIPFWYKDLESYANNKKIPNSNGTINATIKRCMPVFDSITTGYIIYTYSDIYVSQDETKTKELMENMMNSRKVVEKVNLKRTKNREPKKK